MERLIRSLIFFVIVTILSIGSSCPSSLASPTTAKTGIKAHNKTRADPGDKYFPSINNGQWNQGKRDCRNQDYLGLAEIKDADELDLIKRVLEDNGDIASTYWVGAKYVPSLKKFRWTETSELVGDWLDGEWEEGYPGGFMNAQTALQLKYTRDGEWKFRTGVTSHNARYLCEGNESSRNRS
ncbi:Macrophage mannose receptor 1 [Orchesella cincta]|uniref:Macrophage mannose receptor 1 n=1 Tax=Orchesella cincta TaxID=48709 RepID=A0A1D2MNN7_ORCCI|nr:Macrophage mannose receptor 1 [Orchesella cincta]